MAATMLAQMATSSAAALRTTFSDPSHYRSAAFWMLLVFPLFTFMLVRLAIFCLRRTARQAMIQVKKVKETISNGHFLDIDTAFVQEMATSDKYCRVMSLASYLGALDYGGDDDVAYRIVSTLVAAMGGDSIMPLLPLIPASALPKAQLMKSTSLIARFTFTEFPSILTLAALVDSATQFTRQVADDEKNIELPPGTFDAMDLLARGEPPGVMPLLPPSLLECTTLTLNSANTLRHLVEKGMDLGNRPDSKHYDFPKPFAPSLLPGLCKGNGGLAMTTTPRMQCQNRAMTVIMNKLSSNFLGWAGYGPFSQPKKQNDKESIDGPASVEDIVIDENSPRYPEFSVLIGDEETKPIFTVGEFIHALVERGGGEFRCCIRTNITAFGVSLCVLDEDAEKSTQGSSEINVDECDDERRKRYTHIPLAFCSRTGIVCPFTGDPITQLSTHSAIEWHFTNNKFLGPEEVIVTFYTGIEGFTGFKPGGEWDRPWVMRSAVEREFSYDEAVAAADLSACESVCSNICVRVWKFPFGGYGGLGVCADSVAAVEHALRGRTTIFPLFMRGDAKNGLLYVIHEHIRLRLLACLDFLPEGNVRAQLVDDFLDLMNRIARTLIRLPNDIQVEPHEILDSLDRVNACTMNSAFLQDQREKSRLKSIKAGWSKALKEFETDFESFYGGHPRMKRQGSVWRL